MLDSRRLRVSASALSILLVLGAASVAIGGSLKTPLKPGNYKCKVSKEYKPRACAVKEGEMYDELVLEAEGHLLLMRGEVVPTYNYSKRKTQVYIEARLTGDRPYLCSAKDLAGMEECKNQTILIELNKKGKVWTGSYLVTHYMDHYVGEGDERRIEGYDKSVDRLVFQLK